jgi:hypothetical protein
MNQLKQRELCGEARRWRVAQHDSGSGGDFAGFPPSATSLGLAQLSLFFSVYVCKQVKAPAADASRKE